MLFAFRGIRFYQAILALGALGTGLGAVFALKAFVDGTGPPFIFLALILGATFLFLFSAALRAPTSFVAVAPERTRIRYSPFVDHVLDNRDIVDAEIIRHPWWGGIGVRTMFRGEVALASVWGRAARLTLREPLRVWLIPKLIPVRTTRLTVTVRNPEKLVERFRQAAPAPAQTAPSARKMRNRGSRTR